MSEKCRKKEAKARAEVVKHLRKGDMDSAKIYAEMAIREKGQVWALQALEA
jgi:hypothetical protein